MPLDRNPIALVVKYLRHDIQAFGGWFTDEEARSTIRTIYTLLAEPTSSRSLVDIQLRNLTSRSKSPYRETYFQRFIERTLPLMAEANLEIAYWKEKYGVLAFNHDGSVAYMPQAPTRKIEYLAEGWNTKHGDLALR